MIVCSGILQRKTWEIILIISPGIAECQVTHTQFVVFLKMKIMLNFKLNAMKERCILNAQALHEMCLDLTAEC